MSLKFIVYKIQKKLHEIVLHNVLVFFLSKWWTKRTYTKHNWWISLVFFVNIVCALLCIDVLLLFWNGLKTQSSDQSVVKKKEKRNEESLHFIQTSFLCENFNLKDLNKLKKSFQKTFSYLYHLPLKRKYTQFIERRSNWIKKKTMHKLLSSHWIM